MLPSSRVLSAAAARLIRIICASPKPGHSGARSAMSSPSLCVEDTIARCIAAAMKLRGGRRWIRSDRAARALWLETHPIATDPDSCL